MYMSKQKLDSIKILEFRFQFKISRTLILYNNNSEKLLIKW